MFRFLGFTKAQWVGFCVIIVSIGLISFQALRSGSVVTFYTPAELQQKSQEFSHGERFRVSGLVVAHSIVRATQNSTMDFCITDLKGHDFFVSYTGSVPDLFKENQGVVIDGSLDSQNHKRILAEVLMVKHSEVYDTKVDHTQLKAVKLLDSEEQR